MSRGQMILGPWKLLTKVLFYSLSFGWIVPIAILFVISFPPVRFIAFVC